MEFKNDLIADIRIQSLGSKHRRTLVTHSDVVNNLLTRFVGAQEYCIINALLELASQHSLLKTILT